MAAPAISRGGPERIVELEPLWKALHAHQRSVGPRVAEHESLSVLTEERGDGLGGRLLDAVFEELRRQGIDELALAVMAGNEDATRFYERRGLVPYVTVLLGRVPPEA